MYDLIQSALTAATDFTAIAGITGIAAHAIWKQHTTWMSTYCPTVAPYTPDVQVEEEVATPVPQHFDEAQCPPEPEVVIADPWEAPITTSSRRWVSRQPESIKPVLALCPAKEVKPATKPQPTPIDLNALDAVARVEVAKQRQTQLIELDALTDHTLEGLADVVSKIQCSAPDAIASLKTAVLTLFDSGDDGNDGGNQPTEPAPDDPTPRVEQPQTYNSSDVEELETVCAEQPHTYTPGSTLVDENGSLGIVIGINNVGMSVDWLGLGRCPNPASGKGIWYNWAKDNHAIASFKPAAHDQVKLLSTSDFLQLQGWQDEQLEEHWGNEWFDVGVGCKCKWGGATIDRWIVVFAEVCEWASPLATPIACTVEFPQPEPEQTTYAEFVKVSDRIGYIKLNTTGEIIATYAGFNNKARAKNWASYLETVTSRIELRAAKRLGDWKHELKMSGLSIKQIERLAGENLDKMPPNKEPSLPPTYKPQPIPQPVNPDEVEPGDIVTALLTPSASYKIIQVMPNGILDCENLTSGDRLGLRPGAVSLVQKAEKSQDPEAQTTTVGADDASDF
jgi:hypothetical protein